MPIARRGEVWQVDLELTAKVRPALILSIPFQDHERAVYTIVPHTLALRGTRFEVKLEIAGIEAGALMCKVCEIFQEPSSCAGGLC